MSKFINDMQMLLANAGGSAGLTALFIAGFFALWYGRYNGRKEVNYLFWYALITLLLVINPMYYYLVEKIMPGALRETVYSWILPATPVILYSGIVAMSSLNSKSKRLLFAIGLMAILVLASTTSFSPSAITLANSGEYIDENLKSIYDKVLVYKDNKDLDTITIVGPDKVIENARIYTDDIYTLYGKDIWCNDLGSNITQIYSSNVQNIHNEMNAPQYYYYDIGKRAYEEDCDVIIFATDSFINYSIEIPDVIGDMYYLAYERNDYLMYIKSRYQKD